MRDKIKVVLICAFVALLSAGVVAWAQQTNYLGTVFIADYATPSQQLHVNSDGSINVIPSGTGPSGGPVEIYDGTNGPVAVKAASTAPVATDKALVVGISPNSINANGQAISANSAPVVIASDQSSIPVTGASTQSYADACASPGIAKLSVAIALTSAATSQLIALSGSTVIYVCGFTATVPNTATTATSLKFIAGTGTNCGTVTATLTGPLGSNDAAAVSANPIVLNYGGSAMTIFATPAASELCAVVTGNGTLDISGVLTYVQK